jgi:hypothetical protein
MSSSRKLLVTNFMAAQSDNELALRSQIHLSSLANSSSFNPDGFSNRPSAM